MPLFLRATTVFPYASGLPKDVSENTFSFFSDLPSDPAIRTEVVNRLLAFYNSVHAPGTAAICTFISPIVQRAQCRIKLATINSETGLQSGLTEERAFALGTTPSGASLPLEVALVASFRGPTSGGSLPLQSRTGRVFIGPLTSSSQSAAVDPIPSSGLINAMLGASKALAEQSDTDAVWTIWSRKYEALSGVTTGWVDNEWDTQRRRGNEATSRSAWAAA